MTTQLVKAIEVYKISAWGWMTVVGVYFYVPHWAEKKDLYGKPLYGWHAVLVPILAVSPF